MPRHLEIGIALICQTKARRSNVVGVDVEVIYCMLSIFVQHMSLHIIAEAKATRIDEWIVAEISASSSVSSAHGIHQRHDDQ